MYVEVERGRDGSVFRAPLRLSRERRGIPGLVMSDSISGPGGAWPFRTCAFTPIGLIHTYFLDPRGLERPRTRHGAALLHGYR